MIDTEQEQTTLEAIEDAIQREFDQESETQDAVAQLLTAAALVEIAKCLQFFRDEFIKDTDQRKKDEEEWREDERKRAEGPTE